MSEVTIETLKAIFPVQSIPFHGGDCVVIPSKSFLAEWGPALAAQGYKVHASSFDGSQVFLVSLKQNVPFFMENDPKEVYAPTKEREKEKEIWARRREQETVPRERKVPFKDKVEVESQITNSNLKVETESQKTKLKHKTQPEKKGHTTWAPWTKEDLERFIKCWNENPSYANLQKAFPERTKIALVKQATELKKAGTIENSYVVNARLKNKEPLIAGPVQEPKPAGNPDFQGGAYMWSDVETQLIIKMWNEEATADQIHQELIKISPHRTLKALRSKIQRLQDREIILPRLLRGEKMSEKKKSVKVREGAWNNPAEDQLIIALFNQLPQLFYSQIAKRVHAQFPDRSEAAVNSRIYVLQKKGVLKLRGSQKKTPAKESPPKLYPIHNHLDTEPCTEKCPNYRARLAPEQPEQYMATNSANANPFNLLIGEFKTLKEDHEALKIDHENLRAFVEANLTVKNQLEKLERELKRHKHAETTGEAMLPFKEE